MRKWQISITVLVAILTLLAGQVFAEKTKIVWAIGSATRLPAYENIAKQYMALNPNVEVSINVIANSYNSTLQTWLVSGVQVDLLWIGAALVSIGDLLLPVDDLVQKDKYVGGIHPSLLATAKWDGKQIGLPFGVNTNVVYYNKQMFSTAGVAKPADNWTYSDLTSIGKKITTDTNGDGKPDIWGVSPYGTVVPLVQGGNFYNADRRKANFNNPVSVEAMQYIIDLNNGKYGICYPQVPSAQRDPMFFDGKVAMYNNGTFFLPTMGSNAKYDWDLVPFPGWVRDGKRYDATFVSLENWAVNRNTKNQAITKDFLSFLFSPKAMEPIVNLGVVIPSQSQHWADYIKQQTPPDNIYAFMKSIDYTRGLYWDHPLGAAIESNVLSTNNTLYKNMTKGTVPASLAFPELEKQVNAYLDEWWANRDSGK